MDATREAVPPGAPGRPPAELALGARRQILRFARDQQVHLGSSLSVVDLLVAVLRESGGLAADRADPDRPRLVLSKGHAVWALYAVLAEHGLLDPERPGPWAGHPTDGLPGVDAATGALGHGLSIGAGLAEAARLRGSDRRTYVVLGDGELNEGSVWEAVMFAAHRRLDRLVALVDVNGMQQEGATADLLDLRPLDEKWRAFGWRVLPVDGHDHPALRAALSEAAEPTGRPTVLLAHTVKGKGVPFMEHSAHWHTGTLDQAQFAAALAALGTDGTGNDD
ncbi:transketolase [Streptacidiphilus sp. P02-A3a]|uniref:transketolase n=1 Tax=Streptacidiphilus sp. P02-A3a TaxID=2704468 RepID=UPI0015FCCD68|nr:transketolase [Streptacidiphilus sp. P02-A3a]QMU67382.1 transketolase [Streptacidiphilus sp. P02-A3a]